MSLGEERKWNWTHKLWELVPPSVPCPAVFWFHCETVALLSRLGPVSRDSQRASCNTPREVRANH